MHLPGAAGPSLTVPLHLPSSNPVAPRSGATVDLSSIEVVHVESRAALAVAHGMGLSRAAEVRTTSPAFLLDATSGAKAVDEKFTPARLRQFFDEAAAWAMRCAVAVEKAGLVPDVAALVGRRVSRFQTNAFRAACLELDDFERSVAAITFEVADAYHRRVLNDPAVQVLRANPRFREIRLPESVLVFDGPLVPPSGTFKDRLRTAPWSSKIFRVASALWARSPIASPRGTILLLSENSLIKETAYALAKRGYGLHRIRTPAKTGTPGADLFAEVRRCIEPIVFDQLGQWLVAPAVAGTAAQLFADLESTLAQYADNLAGWRRDLDGLKRLRPRIILTNLISNPQSTALAVAARERRIPIACFQHGVAREISLVGDRDEVWYETTEADIFFTHSHEAARITNASRLGRGRAVAAGLEQDFIRAGGLRPTWPEAPPVWYISTMLHIGNFSMVSRGMRDVEQTRLELRMLDEVLAQLPHKILYKPYPARRYTDIDPVLDRARRISHLKVYEEYGDLRYMLRNCRVLVASRPASTTGVCVMSGKPVVYVVVPGRPLSPEARPYMERGLFLFDANDSDFHARIRAFLQQPIADIEALWRERARAREELIKRFFDVSGGRAGSLAARLLDQAAFDPKRLT